MNVFCTYCSAEKDPFEDGLPAIQRYRSPRIRSIYTAALSSGVHFLILSGKYGLIGPCDRIPFYDHLLMPSEVSQHAQKVTEQLKTMGVRSIVFFSLPLSQDSNVKPYLDCIQLACRNAGVPITFIEIEPLA